MTALRLKSGINVTWSRPDSSITPFCSRVGCGKHIPEDTVPLMMWNDSGACVQFCDECAEKCFELPPPAEDDFLHYFNATGRLSKEVLELRAKVTWLEKDLHQTLRAVLYHFGPAGALKVTSSVMEARKETTDDPPRPATRRRPA